MGLTGAQKEGKAGKSHSANSIPFVDTVVSKLVVCLNISITASLLPGDAYMIMNLTLPSSEPLDGILRTANKASFKEWLFPISFLQHPVHPPQKLFLRDRGPLGMHWKAASQGKS